MFLSLRMHARHWSNPLGRHFFQDQTKATDRTSDPDAPNQRPATRHHRCGGHRRDRRARAAVPVGGGARAHTCPPGDHRRACGTTGVWLRRSWAAAGPGRTTRRRVQPHISITSPTGVEGAGGTGGHGRASRRGAERSEALASRAAGPSGARNTRGATSNNTREQMASGRAGHAAAGDQAAPGTPVGPQATPPKRKAYNPRNALIAGISRTACTRPAR